jgi:hypothetical protein
MLCATIPIARAPAVTTVPFSVTDAVQPLPLALIPPPTPNENDEESSHGAEDALTPPPFLPMQLEAVMPWMLAEDELLHPAPLKPPPPRRHRAWQAECWRADADRATRAAAVARAAEADPEADGRAVVDRALTADTTTAAN